MGTSLFITGASSGIGAAFLEGRPADVGTPHSFSRREAPGHWVQTDLSHPRQWPAVFEAIETALDDEKPEHAIFFHCAGGGDPIGRVVDLDPMEYALSVTMNTASGPALGQAFLRACHQRGIRATLVLASSPAAEKDVPGMAMYCAAKDALQHWGTVVSMELTPESGSRIITVVPYAVLTDVVRSVMTRDPEEVPLVTYFRQVDAANEFASPQLCAEQIWSAVDTAENGAVVPVGAVWIAERNAAAAAAQS